MIDCFFAGFFRASAKKVDEMRMFKLRTVCILCSGRLCLHSLFVSSLFAPLAYGVTSKGLGITSKFSPRVVCVHSSW